MKLRDLLCGLALVAVPALSACGGGAADPSMGPPSPKDILGLSLGVHQIGEAAIDPATHAVAVRISTNGHLGALVASFDVSPGATVTPASGSTLNFSGGPLVFRVTGADGTHQDWTVTVTATRPHRRLFHAAGADGVLGTADDVVSSFSHYSYDGVGRIRTLDFFQLGSDGVPGTADDVQSQRNSYEVDALGEATLSRIYSSGSDGVFGTADDTLQGIYTRFLTTPTGVLLGYALVDAGADRAIATLDDTVVLYHETIRDAEDRVVQMIAYKGAGGDRAWFTSDDVLEGHVDFDLDGDGNTVAGWTFGLGPDGILSTPDDTLTGWFVQENE